MAQFISNRPQSALTKIKLGSKVESSRIPKVDVADGSRGRVIFLTDEPLRADVIFINNDRIRGSFYATREQALLVGELPRTYILALVARLNTDRDGKVLDDSFKVEVLRMSEKAYADFAKSYEGLTDDDGNSEMKTAMIEKSTGSSEQYKYIAVTASKKSTNPTAYKSVLEKIKNLRIDVLESEVMFEFAQPFENLQKLTGIIDDVNEGKTTLAEALPSYVGKAVQIPQSVEESEDFEEGVEVEESEPLEIPKDENMSANDIISNITGNSVESEDNPFNI